VHNDNYKKIAPASLFDLLTPKYCINTSIVSVKIFSPLEKLRSVRSKCKATPWLLYVTAINVFHNVDACVSNCSKVNDCGNVGVFLFESGSCKCKQRRVCRKVDREGTMTKGICRAFGASSTSIGSDVEEEEVEVVEVVEVVVVVTVSVFKIQIATQEQCSK
jgi:hypothetical protein